MNTLPARAFGIALAAFYFLHCAFMPTDFHFIDNANLMFHEAGHAIFIFFGDFVRIAMGSGFQVLLPLSIAGYFFFTSQPLSGAFSLMWAGENLINVSVYADDAIVTQLPLLGGDGAMHDWHYLLTSLGILPYTLQVAEVIYDTGLTAIFGGIMIACLMLYREYRELR